MIQKLCYLFTFIFSITNMLNITNINWMTVFAPSVIALLFIVAYAALLVLAEHK